MALVKQFEDLECWKLARVYVKKVYRNTSREQLQNDFGFQSKIRNAGVSIIDNIAEGFGRLNKKEFRRCIDIASGSLAETKSMTYIAHDLNCFSTILTEELQVQNAITKSEILRLIKYLNTKIYYS